MKLRTKLTLFSIVLIVLAIAACCAIILTYANRHEMQAVTGTGLQDHAGMVSAFRNAFSHTLPAQPAVRRSLLIHQFRSLPGAEEFTLRDADGYLCNNIGFAVESMFGERSQSISDDGTQYRAVRVGGEAYFIAHAPLRIGDETYELSLARNITAIVWDMQTLAANCIAAGLAIALAAAALMWLIVLRALKPIKGLQAGTNELAAGNYEKRIALAGKDELAALAADFNSMADAIEANIGELHETAQRQQVFISGLSHEMKTPVTAILLSAETLLGRQVPPAAMARSLERIYDQGKWLEQFSQKLTALVLLNGDIETRSESVVDLLAAVSDSTLDALREKNMELIIDCGMDKLPMDFDLMRSALVNLVDNARKASKPGQRIELHAHGGTIAVIDYGVGIPAEEIERVLEPFYMVDRSRSKKAGGSGLGLALVQKITQAHGAVLAIESVVRQGTTVRMHFEGSQ